MAQRSKHASLPILPYTRQVLAIHSGTGVCTQKGLSLLGLCLPAPVPLGLSVRANQGEEEKEEEEGEEEKGEGKGEGEEMILL
jgi:hypothetical protein